jgi:hypothetical protein
MHDETCTALNAPHRAEKVWAAARCYLCAILRVDFALRPPLHLCSGICCLYLFFFPKALPGVRVLALATNYPHQNGYSEASLLMIVALVGTCSLTVIHLIQQAEVLKL